MKRNKIYILLFVAVFLVVGCVFNYVRNIHKSQIASTVSTGTPQPTITHATTTQPEISWVTYANTEYGYSIKHPDDAVIQPVAEEERLPIERSGYIEMGGDNISIRIGVWQIEPKKQNTEFPQNDMLAALDLKSFAETLRKKEDDHNPEFPNKKVGELEETRFAGYKAYAVSVTGYTTYDGEHRIIYFDGKTNRFVITYSLNGDLSERIIDTFQLTR